MKVIAIIATVIFSFAYQGYDNFVAKAQRSDAKIYLNKIALLQENFKANCSTYTSNVVGGSIQDCTGLGLKATSPDGYYRLVSNPRGGSFQQPALPIKEAWRVSVVPVAGSMRPDNGKLGLDSIGGQRWDRDNNGRYDHKERSWHS